MTSACILPLVCSQQSTFYAPINVNPVGGVFARGSGHLIFFGRETGTKTLSEKGRRLNFIKFMRFLLSLGQFYIKNSDLSSVIYHLSSL